MMGEQQPRRHRIEELYAQSTTSEEHKELIGHAITTLMLVALALENLDEHPQARQDISNALGRAHPDHDDALEKTKEDMYFLAEKLDELYFANDPLR